MNERLPNDINPLAPPTSGLDGTEIIAGLIRNRLALSSRTPLIVGLCGAQGSGKTTMANALAVQFNLAGVRTVVLSLDDLYLGAAERRELAQTVHPLFAVRGVPATHDIDFGLDLVERLQRTKPVAMPRFDKATDDRLAEPLWPAVTAPIELVLFEGWCVGARPQLPQDLVAPINRLEAERDPDGIWRRYVNATLAGSYQRLFARIDVLVLLAAPGFDVVRDWRRQQEEDLRRRSHDNAPGLMDAAGIDSFVQYFERLTRHILIEMPAYADLVLALDDDRNVVSTRRQSAVSTSNRRGIGAEPSH